MALGDLFIPGLQQLACAISSGVGGNPYSGGPTLRIPPGGGSSSGNVVGNSADAVTRWACGLGPPPDPVPPEPSPYRPVTNREGGYCDASYNMTVFWKYKLYPSGAPTDNPPLGSAVIPVLGPIVGFFTEDYPSPSLVARNSAGTRYNVNSIFNDTLDYAEITSVTFERIDGQPDDCSAPPFRPVTIPIPIPDPRGPGFPPIIVTPFAPVFIGPNTLNLPFNLDIGGVDLNINIDLGTGEPTITPPGELPQNCCVPILRSPPGSTGDGEDQGPDLQYLVGVHTRIAVSEPNPFTEILPSAGGPSIWAPRLGSVSFKVRAGSKVGWTPDIDIKYERQWTAVPGNLYAVDYQVTSGYNVTIDAEAVYVEPPETTE